MKIGHAPSHAPAVSARLLRFACLVSFAITLVAIAVLAVAKSAQASSTAPAHLVDRPALLLPLEEEAEGEYEEEWEEDEELEEEDEGAKGSAEPPEECGLRSARASAVADESQARVRTQVSYTSFEPVRAEIDFKLSGPKGSVTIGRDRKQLSYSGAIRGSEQLSAGELAKALVAQRITVTVRVLEAPATCRRYSDRHLKSRKAGGDRIAWLQSDSVFGF